MSNATPIDSQQAIIDSFFQSRVAHYCILAPVAVLYFDWLLTFSAEFSLFWKKPRHGMRLTFPTGLFFINRYLCFLSFVPIMVQYFSNAFSDEVCKNLFVPYLAATNIVSQAVVGAILILRTYALYRSTSIFIATVLLWAISVTLAGWAAGALQSVNRPVGMVGCLVRISDEGRHRAASAWIGLLVFETFIFVLTIRKGAVFPTSRTMTIVGRSNGLLSKVLFHGSIYYLVLLGLNCFTIATICFATEDLRCIGITITQIIPVTVISRLLLDLRKGMRPPPLPSTTSSSAASCNHLTSPDMLTTMSGPFVGDLGVSYDEWWESDEHVEQY